MRIKLSNSELLAFADLVQASAAKYAQVVEVIREDNRRRVAANMPPEDNDSDINQAQLMGAIFDTLSRHLEYKALDKRKEYSMELTPVWAFAIRLEYNGVLDVTQQIGNSVQMLCDAIHQQYQ